MIKRERKKHEREGDGESDLYTKGSLPLKVQFFLKIDCIYQNPIRHFNSIAVWNETLQSEACHLNCLCTIYDSYLNRECKSATVNEHYWCVQMTTCVRRFSQIIIASTLRIYWIIYSPTGHRRAIEIVPCIVLCLPRSLFIPKL